MNRTAWLSLLVLAGCAGGAELKGQGPARDAEADVVAPPDAGVDVDVSPDIPSPDLPPGDPGQTTDPGLDPGSTDLGAPDPGPGDVVLDAGPDAADPVCVTAEDCADLVEAGPCQGPACVDGQCALEPLADGLECEDDDVCTLESACAAGVCEAIATLECADDDVCTDDLCDPEMGCVYEPNASNCDDGDVCTVLDVCYHGVCLGLPLDCDDDNPCTDDACSELGACVYSNNTAACLDGDSCTTNDVCADGICAGIPIPDCVGPKCGDGMCEGGETCTTCPQDCPICCDADEVVNCNNGCTSDYWVGDGWCDTVLDCAELGWDGGDCLNCANGEVPDCNAVCAPQSLLGDGSCHDSSAAGADFNCATFQADQGDCPPCPSGEIPACTGGCAPEWQLGNDQCDEVFDCPKYIDDQGDCCPDGQINSCMGSCTTTFILGNGVCDPVLNCLELDFDDGDCSGSQCPVEVLVDCDGQCADPALKGDGTCHDGSAGSSDLNCWAHQFDGDDCNPCPTGEIPDCDGSGCVALSKLGDGTCDAELECPVYNNDAEDCCALGQVLNCQDGCSNQNWLGDGACDFLLNCAAHDYDAGDCGGDDCPPDATLDCNELCVDPALVGDDVCHDGTGGSKDLNCDAHDNDGHDCSDCGADLPACGGGCAPASQLGDGTCQAALDCLKNGFDGGDCP